MPRAQKEREGEREDGRHERERERTVSSGYETKSNVHRVYVNVSEFEKKL